MSMASQEPISPSPAPAPLRGRRVLVVEDEPFIALNLVFGIEQEGGVALGPATTVAEALRLIETELPDAAIVDVDLPDGTIEPVLQVLRPRVPVIVHTGVGLPDHLRQAHPDVEVCSKPTPPIDLVRRLRRGGMDEAY
ncbi:CheY-like chemotaxis protein [Brevirhabdus pacifica]|nr:response regulator [Brevirhabdus pacifica]PJJ86215.1 CheY-like chemotaxis protein [Brevirhabdus pacifica]